MENKVDELIAKFLEKSHCNCAPGICTGTFPTKMCRRFMVREIIDVCLAQRVLDGLTSAQKEEVRQMIQSALDTGSA